MPYYTNLNELIKAVDGYQFLNDISLDENTVFSFAGGNNLSLKQMLENTEKNITNLLNILGFNGNDYHEGMKELNQRIQEFQYTTSSFNGQELRKNIINKIRGVAIDDYLTEAQKFKKFMNDKSKEIEQVFIDLVEKIAEENIELTETQIADIVYKNLNQMSFEIGDGETPKKGGGTLIKTDVKKDLEGLSKNILTKIRSGIKTIEFSGHLDPNVKMLIKRDASFTRRLLYLAEEKKIQSISSVYEQNIQPPEFEIAQNDKELTIFYDITTPFAEKIGGNTEKVAADYFKNLKEPFKTQEIEKLTDRAIEFLMPYFNSNNLTTERAQYLKDKFIQAIRDILTNYPAAIFTGKNEQGIIGILGEIQGLYYLYSILGDNQLQIDEKQLVQWIGGDTGFGGGVKTGADLIVKIGEKTGYGIQIKNSMVENSETSFSDFIIKGSGDEFFKQMSSFFPYDILVAIEDILTMKSFNIGYHYEGKTAVKGLLSEDKDERVSVYKTTYEEIQKLYNIVTKLIAIAATFIMRVQTLNGEDYEQKNTLWLIGGTLAISSAQILENLIKQIKGELNNFKLLVNTTYSEGNNKSSFTIINYLNENRLPETNLKTVLQTSYNFHRI